MRNLLNQVAVGVLTLTAAVCIMAGIPAAAQTSARQGVVPPAPGDTPKIEFERYTLPNGLRVILHVDRKLPIVNVNQWFHVGSKNEKPGRTGFAHLFEHMMFQGSKNAEGEYFTYAERAGANLFEGGVNGTTDQDRTNYFATVPSGNLENVLWFESDRLATLTDVTTQEKLDNQRDVVKNERRQRLENEPYGRLYPLLIEAVFPAGHPYSWPVIGSQEDLTAASLDDVKEFFRTYYTPNNLSLVIAGDFDPDQARALIAKYFGGIPPGPALDRPSRWIPQLDGEKVFEVSDRVSLERVYIGWPAPEYFSSEDAVLDLTARILGDGLSARLNRILVYEKQIASGVEVFNAPGEIAGLFVIQATARPGASLTEIESIITGEIARLAKDGPTAAELERAKNKRESEFISGLERIGGFGGKADVLNQYNTFLGEPEGRLEADLARYRTVTPDAVRDATNRWLNTRNRAVVRFHPETSSLPSGTTLDRSKQPPLGDDRPFVAPVVKTAKLENGLEVFVLERTNLPKVNVTLVTRAGAAADPAGKAGVAHLTVTVLDLGTKTRNALETEDAFADLGTTLTSGAGREGARLGFDVLKRNLAPALALAADVVMHPAFPDGELARERKRVLDTIAQQDLDANALAARICPILAFGQDHPYGRPVQGTRGSVEGITRDDLMAFHQARWKPGSSALVIAGDVTLAEATALARQHFGAWTGGAAAPITVPRAVVPLPNRVYIVDRPDAAQTVVAQWLPAPERTSPDYDALKLADAVWGGGGFGTRLNLNLREDKGYSYGVFSILALMTHAGAWSAAGGVQTNKTKESVLEFDRELKAIAGARPISEDEFKMARERRMRGYAQQFESLGRLAGQVADNWTLGLPPTELQREYDATVKATLAQALEAARKYARPDAASLLLVGDRSKIEPGIRELQLGEVVVLDVEGRPVAKGAN